MSIYIYIYVFVYIQGIRRPPLSASRRWTLTLPAFNDKTQRHLLLPFPRLELCLGPNPDLPLAPPTHRSQKNKPINDAKRVEARVPARQPPPTHQPHPHPPAPANPPFPNLQVQFFPTKTKWVEARVLARQPPPLPYLCPEPTLPANPLTLPHGPRPPLTRPAPLPLPCP